MTEYDYHDYLDLNDGGPSVCPTCGEPMQTDEDGDGVMTMSYEFCENCGTKDYGEPVNLMNEALAKMRADENKPETPT